LYHLYEIVTDLRWNNRVGDGLHELADGGVVALHQADHEHVGLLLYFLIQRSCGCPNRNAHVVGGYSFKSSMKMLSI
jgi:hypothetical protein